MWHGALVVEYAELMALPRVTAVSAGWKETDGWVRRRPSVKICVTEKVSKSRLAARDLIPKFAHLVVPIGGDRYQRVRVPTDVIWDSPAQLCALPSDFLDPALSGAMIVAKELGTLGCRVRDANGIDFGVTAGHVIQGNPGPVGPNITVLQPNSTAPIPPSPPAPAPPTTRQLGRSAGGEFRNLAGGFRDFATIRLGTRAALSASVDGLMHNGIVLTEAQIGALPIRVTKFGAITMRTNGAASGFKPSIALGTIIALNVLEILGDPASPFASPGDSGSLVVSGAGATKSSVVGLLVGAAPPMPDSPGGRGYVVPFARLTGLTPV